MIGYYNALQDLNKDEHGYTCKAGDLVLFMSDDGESFKTETYHDGWSSTTTFDIEEIEKFFVFNPKGAEDRQKEVADLMQGLMDLNMENISPHIEGGVLNIGCDIQDTEVETGLIAPSGNMLESKRSIAMVRNKVARTQKLLKEKNELLQSCIKEQSAILKARANELSKVMKVAEEAIWSINLYLGKNEDIIQIQKGEPAPVDTKISIRQKVLFMDEECALFADEGGITANNADEFDQWILASKRNLEQVLPEQKGILAVKIKRFDDTDYTEWDPLSAANAKDRNLKWTYFLIRNGDNLYRVFVDFVVGDNLFPTKSEYEGLFDSDEPLKPGDKRYMHAMESSEKLQKHYLRVVLILQGLIDRTPIFQPMPLDRINLCNQNECMAFIDFVYDNEMILGDGRPSFDDWLRSVNANLQVGHRIIGNFGYRAHLHGYTEGRSTYDVRLYPANADNPDSNVLYTIEGSEKAGVHRTREEAFIFRFERGRIYDRKNWGYKEAETRARCIIYKSDDFVIDFDSVDPEDCRYYLTSRIHRKNYKDMLPLMELVIQLKEQEKTEEAPFRQLLIGEIMKTGESVEAATDAVDELIKWWKFKNRTHRALTSDDQKAIDMIVTEFGLRKTQRAVRQQIEDLHAHIITAVTSLVTPIMIAHKKDNQYVAYVPHNDDDIWVEEQLWAINRQTLAVRQKEIKKWKTVDKRFERWEIIYKSSRWDKWQINPIMADILTDPEIEGLCDYYTGLLNEYNAGIEPSDPEDSLRERRRNVPFVPLTIMRDKFKFYLSAIKQNAIIPELVCSGEYPQAAEHYCIELSWKRSTGGIKYSNSTFRYNSPRDYGYYSHEGSAGSAWKIARIWPQNIEANKAEYERVRQAKERRTKCEYMYRYVSSDLNKLNIEQQKLALWNDYVVEHGDPELFDDHVEAQKLRSQLDTRTLNTAFEWCAERDIPIVGKTIREVLDIVEQFGFSNEHQIGSNVPLDYVIKPKDEDQ